MKRPESLALPLRVSCPHLPFVGITDANVKSVVPSGALGTMAGVSGETQEQSLGRARFLVTAANCHEVLTKAWAFVKIDIDQSLRSLCVCGPDGEPDRSTLDEIDAAYIGRAEDVLAQIDTALIAAGVE